MSETVKKYSEYNEQEKGYGEILYTEYHTQLVRAADLTNYKRHWKDVPDIVKALWTEAATNFTAYVIEHI